MLPAWCHLSWHLELTAWKVLTWPLLSCLRPLLLLGASSPTPAGTAASGAPTVPCRPSTQTLPSPAGPLPGGPTDLSANYQACSCQVSLARMSLSHCTLLRSCFQWESSWRTRTGHLWSRNLDEMTPRGSFQLMCFYQSENFMKYSHQNSISDTTAMILREVFFYGISKLAKTLTQTNIPTRNLFC